MLNETDEAKKKKRKRKKKKTQPNLKAPTSENCVSKECPNQDLETPTSSIPVKEEEIPASKSLALKGDESSEEEMLVEGMNPFINPLEEHNIYQQLKKKLQKSSNTDSSPSTEKPEEESSVLIPSRLQSLSDLLNNHETWTSVSFEEVVKAWCQLANLQSGFWLSGEGGSHRVFHTPFGLSYVV